MFDLLYKKTAPEGVGNESHLIIRYGLGNFVHISPLIPKANDPVNTEESQFQAKMMLIFQAVFGPFSVSLHDYIK